MKKCNDATKPIITLWNEKKFPPFGKRTDTSQENRNNDFIHAACQCRSQITISLPGNENK